MRLEPGADVLLSVLLVRYYEKHAKKLPSGRNAFLACGLWTEHFGEVTIADLTPDALDDFIEWLREEGGIRKVTPIEFSLWVVPRSGEPGGVGRSHRHLTYPIRLA